MAPDLYALLGVSKDATASQLKKAYRVQAHRYHPDKNPGDARAEERFKDICRAYEILGDPKQRRKYDTFGAAAFTANPFADFDPGLFVQNVGEVFGDVFSDIFGKGTKGKTPSASTTEIDIDLTLEEAYRGCQKQADVELTVPCPGCKSQNERRPICKACAGIGQLRVSQGLFTIKKACPFCDGSGQRSRQDCDTCRGTGHTQRRVTIQVLIPPGCLDQAQIAATSPVPQGRITARIHIAPHPIFMREQQTLRCSQSITATQAILGTQIEVPTLGAPVRLKVPPSSQPGTTLRLRQKGMPYPHLPSDFGDLLVLLHIELPSALTEAQQALLRQFQGTETKGNYPGMSAGSAQQTP